MKIGAGVLLLAVFAASPEIRYFRYERPILNTPPRDAQTCLALDPGIFSHAAPQLDDLRLYRGVTEVPYVVRLAAPVPGEVKSITPLNLGRRAGRTVFDAAMPDTKYSDIQLAVTGQNFIATVTVSGSQQQSGSRATRLGAFTIFDLTRQKLGRSTILHLPESDFRYLHFRIDGALAPESITGLSVVRLPAGQPRYVTVADVRSITQKGHTSVVEFTVPAHAPVDRVAFTPGAAPAFFSRDVNISVSPVAQPPAAEDAEPPQTVASSGNLLRLHSEQSGHRIDEERLAIDAPDVDLAAPAKWTITIENGDDAPLTMQSVRLQMLERDFCFEALANTSYALFYGDPALAAPHYDYATLFTRRPDALQVATGPEQPNPAFQPRPDERPFSERHPALLWVALVAVIALLGVIALRSAKRAAKAQP